MQPVTEHAVVGLPVSHRLFRLGLRFRYFEERASKPIRRLEAGDGEFVMVVCLGDPLAAGAPGDPLAPLTALCAGLRARAIATEHQGLLRCIEVTAPALVAAHLWRGACDADGPVDAGEVWCGAARDAVRRATEADSPSDAAALLEAAFNTLLVDGSVEPSPIAQRIWHALAGSGGRAQTGKLATALGISERHAIARFRDATGITPKQAAKRLRFAAARRRLRAGDADLAEVAAACGYADQSHMTREFTWFAGQPPGAHLPS